MTSPPPTGSPRPEPAAAEPFPAGSPRGPAPQLPRRRGFLVAVLGGIVVAGIVTVGVLLDESGGTAASTDTTTHADTRTTLDRAKNACAPTTAAVRLGDDGQSLEISRVAAEEDAGASMDELACVLHRTDIPDAVVAQMETTRAIDGRQDASWNRFSASWTYHPRSGLNVILEES